MKNKLKKRRVGLLLFICVLILLVFGGCAANDANQPADAPKGENQAATTPDPVEIKNPGEVVLVLSNGEKQTVIDDNGNVIIPSGYYEAYIIKDSLTGKQRFIQLQRPAEVSEHIPEGEDPYLYYKYEYALYDLQGKMIYDFGSQEIAGLCGNLLATFSWGEHNEEGRYKWYSELKNTNDWSVVLSGYSHMSSAAPNALIWYYDEENSRESLEIYNAQGELIKELTQYDMLYTYSLDDDYLNASYIIGRIIHPETAEISYDVLDNFGEPVFDHPFDEIIDLSNGYLVVVEDGEYHVYDIAAKEKVFSSPYRINRAKNGLAIVEYWEPDVNGVWIYQQGMALVNFAGERLSDIYDSVYDDREFFRGYSWKDDHGEAAIFDTSGLLLQDFDTNSGYFSILTDDLICYIKYGEDYRYSGSDLYNGKGEFLLSSDYTFISSMDNYYEYEGNNYLLANGYYNNNYLMQICDMQGNPVISNIKAFYGGYKDKFLVERGFDIGLMDANGNWLYSESVFNSLEDDQNDWYY